MVNGDRLPSSVRRAIDVAARPLRPVHTDPFEGIVERREAGLTFLSPWRGRPYRRVVYVNGYGGAEVVDRIRRGSLASHHLWGCLQLVRNGYEVAIAEPLPDFYLYRNPLPHDLKLFRLIRSWLGRDGIVYCGHNVLYWLPLLKALRAVKCHFVSLLFAREPLDFAQAHSGVIALNAAAADHARKLAPRANVAHLGWGVDLSVFPDPPYTPEWFLSCGVTLRDHQTLSVAASWSASQFRVIASQRPAGVSWPANVSLVLGDNGHEAVPYAELLSDHYAKCAASLIILRHDPVQYTGVGTTNLLEAMAMARPVIVTRTGALPTEVDVEAAGCGLFVPSQNPRALAVAVNYIANNPELANRMGARGRQLCESRYNIVRYAADLHALFEAL